MEATEVETRATGWPFQNVSDIINHAACVLVKSSIYICMYKYTYIYMYKALYYIYKYVCVQPKQNMHIYFLYLYL